MEDLKNKPRCVEAAESRLKFSRVVCSSIQTRCLSLTDLLGYTFTGSWETDRLSPGDGSGDAETQPDHWFPVNPRSSNGPQEPEGEPDQVNWVKASQRETPPPLIRSEHLKLSFLRRRNPPQTAWTPGMDGWTLATRARKCQRRCFARHVTETCLPWVQASVLASVFVNWHALVDFKVFEGSNLKTFLSPPTVGETWPRRLSGLQPVCSGGLCFFVRAGLVSVVWQAQRKNRLGFIWSNSKTRWFFINPAETTKPNRKPGYVY